MTRFANGSMLTLASAWLVSACGPQVETSHGGGQTDGMEDAGATEPADGAGTGSPDEDVVEPDLACARGEAIGCLGVQDGEPDLCLCRGPVIPVEHPPWYTDWNVGEIRPGGDRLLAIAGTDPHRDGGYSLSTWRPIGGVLEPVESKAAGNDAERFLVSQILPSLGSAHVIEVRQGAVAMRASVANVGNADALLIVNVPTSSSPLIHAGDFDADGLVDLAAIGFSGTRSSGDAVAWQHFGHGGMAAEVVLTATSELGVGQRQAAATCDLDGDGSTDWIHGGHGTIAYGTPGVGLGPNMVASFGNGGRSDATRCVDLDLDGRLDLLVTVDGWPDPVYGMTSIHYQGADGWFATVLATPALESSHGTPHRGVRAARLFDEPDSTHGLDLVTLAGGTLHVLRAVGAREYGPPRSRDLGRELDLVGVFDVDGDGRDELIAAEYPVRVSGTDAVEDLVVLWVESQ